MGISDIQVRFFKRIKDVLLPQLSLVNEVADLLGISTDSAYRRIRGETALTMEELLLLLKHFRLSLEEFNNAEDTISFSYKVIDNTEITFETYLNAILEDMEKINQAEQKEIIYAAKDVPIFHHFRYPELTAFKIFFWMKSILNCPSHEHIQFDSNSLSETDMVVADSILKFYISVPSTEIWTDETLNSTLKQVEYSWESGFFKEKEDALLICDQLEAMLNRIKKQAELGYKFLSDPAAQQPEGNFKLYLSEVMIGNNNILVKLGQNQVTYLTHNTLNYLITPNTSFCKETESSLRNLMSKSIVLSTASEKQRNQFFKRALDNTAALKARINA